ncbi:GGDEF domain-containing protein [Haematobacter massiliensis]|nr:GGDEF domain-containing protein [Haematobacter massiliensis]OWJ70490.1 GGDEF domain-containing protein [Haematobacter massiliensis]OWJ87369.1 GGDEF domain-containing protein [Haematobacter massiliensis]
MRFSREALARLMPMFLWIDADMTIRAAGPTIARVTGPEPLVGRPFGEVFSLRNGSRGIRLEDIAQSDDPRLYLQLPGRGGRELRGIAVPLGGGEVFLNLSFGVGVAEAVRMHGLTQADFAPTDLAVEMLYLIEAKNAVMGELRGRNDRLRTAKTRAETEALTDPLTGLGNRRAMERALEDVIRTGTPFALVHADLDFFKQVNDTLGHAAGDDVLRETGRILSTRLRQKDHAARIGGDEFVVVLPGVTSVGPLEDIAARLRNRFSRRTVDGATPLRLGASLGAVIVPARTAATGTEILDAADRALYASKQAGRGQLSVSIFPP